MNKLYIHLFNLSGSSRYARKNIRFTKDDRRVCYSHIFCCGYVLHSNDITSNNDYSSPFYYYIVIAGPLADQFFEPWMKEGGLLSSTIFAQLVGTGPGRGIALLFVILGLSNTLASIMGFLYSPLRRVDIDLPDAIPDPKKAK